MLFHPGAHNQSRVVKVSRIELQKSNPEFRHGHFVQSQPWPDFLQVLQIRVKPGIPPIDDVDGFVLEIGLVKFLKYRNNRRLDLLKVVNQHQDVGIGGQAASGGVADITFLGELFDNVSKDFDSEIVLNIFF